MAEPPLIPPEMVIARRFQALEGRVAAIERPTGSQNNRNKDKVQAALDAQQEQIDFQASLITVADQAPSFNSGIIPNDSTTHWLSTPDSLALAITVDVPTGRALVAYGCAEISVQSANNSALGQIGFDLNDDAPNYTARVYVGSGNTWFGAGASRQRVIDVTPGPVTFRARFGVFSAATAGDANVQFNSPWMSVQVLRPA